LQNNLNIYKNTLQEIWEELPPVFVTSARLHQGEKELLTFIENTNQGYAPTQFDLGKPL
jgi:GTP-binding protein